MISMLPVTGGCQCGAVRYSLASPPGGAHFCHCRMCQKAVGGPCAALNSVPTADLTWVRGTPGWYASSNLARRPFCQDCGTPLGFHYVDSDRINVTIGSLDEPEPVPIGMHYGVESRLSWYGICDDLPQVETSDDPDSPVPLTGLISRQGGDGA
jgi:hypothetical protein